MEARQAEIKRITDEILTLRQRYNGSMQVGSPDNNILVAISGLEQRLLALKGKRQQ